MVQNFLLIGLFFGCASEKSTTEDQTEENELISNHSWGVNSCSDSIASTGDGQGQITANFFLNDQNGDTVALHDFCEKTVLLASAALW